MNDFDKRIQMLWSQRPFDSSNHILIGLSGGIDSVVLTHYLLNEQLHPPNKIVTVHVNHGLRATAAAEEAFVAKLTVEWGLKCIIKHIDVKHIQKEERRSLEEAARVGRYRVFAEAAESLSSKVVLVAHHADDQVETVLMNLLRGSGLTGLMGMQPVTRLDSLVVFRPLLDIWRSEITNYGQQHNLLFVEDESNSDVNFQRNQIRHQLIPSLVTYNERAKEHLWQLTQIVRDDVALLEGVLDDYWSAVVREIHHQLVRLDKAEWRQLPVSAQRALLRRAILSLTQSLNDVSFEALENIRVTLLEGGIGAQGELKGVQIVVDYTDLLLHLPYKHPAEIYDLPLLAQQISIQVGVGDQVVLSAGWTLHVDDVSSISLEETQHNQQRWRVYLAVNDDTKLVIQPRQTGERFQPLGMDGTVKVKDVMINEKIPAAVRDYWPIVSDQRGILWVAGLRQAQRSAVTASSSRIWQITIWKKEQKSRVDS